MEQGLRQLVQCASPGCLNCFFLDEEARDSELFFCKECRKEHSYRVLYVQHEHGGLIRDIILDSRVFSTAHGMADYVGVSFVTLYNWIKRYFSMSFQEFRREYICHSNKCYLLDISGSPYSRGDYALKKIKDKRFCACINELGKRMLMTNAPLPLVEGIFGESLKTVDLLYKSPGKIFPLYTPRTIFPVFLNKFPHPIFNKS